MHFAGSLNYFDMVSSARKSYARLLDPVCRRWELTRNELDVMLFLHNNPSYDRAADIVSRRGIAKSHVSLGVAAMEKRGLLLRQFDESDRRTAHLKLTEPGAQIAEEARQEQLRYFSTLYDGITEEEFRLWKRITEKVCANIENFDRTLPEP